MEKTFEELIREYPTTALLSGRKVITDLESLYDLMQQVREATKAEVLKLCDDNFFSKEPKGKLMENIENLPTDRITIEPLQKLTDK